MGRQYNLIPIRNGTVDLPVSLSSLKEAEKMYQVDMVEQIGDNYRLKMNNDAQKCKTIKWIKNDIKKNR